MAGEELVRGRIIGNDVRETVREEGRLHRVLKVHFKAFFFFFKAFVLLSKYEDLPGI